MDAHVTPAVMARPKRERVAVFMDYENVHRTGHRKFADFGAAHHETVVAPVDLALRVCERRQSESELVHVGVYRGRPVPEHQPTPASAFDMQVRKWSSDYRVQVRSRDLKYTFPYEDTSQFHVQEKGIDVALAVDVVEAAIAKRYDAIVVFSCDTDLLPAIELVYRTLEDAHIEIACWSGARPLWLREGLKATPPKRAPYCHFLPEEDFVAARETVHLGAGALD